MRITGYVHEETSPIRKGIMAAFDFDEDETGGQHGECSHANAGSSRGSYVRRHADVRDKRS